MTFFEWVATDDLVCAANFQACARLAAMTDRLLCSRMGHVYRRAESMLRALAEGSVASEPRVHLWCATARALLTADASGTDPEPALVGHLNIDALSRERLFELHVLQGAEALAATLSRARRALTIDVPVRPGERFVAGSLGTFNLKRDVHVRLEAFGKSLLLPGAFEAEVAKPPTVAGIEIPVHDDALCSAWLAIAPVVRSADGVSPFLNALEAALERLETWDSTLRRGCTALVSAVLATHSSGTSFSSSTNESALGLVHLPGITDVDDLADCLVHEAMHTKLYHLESLQPLFAPGSSTAAHFYSPWRSDPRPLRMVLHGAYVFTAVAEYWEFRHRVTDCLAAALNVRRRSAQVLQAVSTLQEHGRFTPIGKRLLDAIASYASNAEARAPVPGNEQIAIDRELTEHRLAHADYVA